MLFVTITHDGEELERFVLPVLTLPSDAVHVARAIRELVETECAGEPPDELSTTIGGME
jgi:cob(I)alamin adenosyltransferase